MRLRNKTLVIISATTFGLTLVLYIVAQSVVLGRFTRLESQLARQNADRIIKALSDEMAALDAVAHTWAMWSETATFVQAPSIEYVQSNLTDDTFTGNDLNVMLYIDGSGQIVYGKVFDLQAGKQAPIPRSLPRHFGADSPFLRQPVPEGGAVGIIVLPEAPLLVAARRVSASGTDGGTDGVLVTGRYLDSHGLERLAERVGLPLTLHRIHDPQMPQDFQAALASLSESEPVAVRLLNIETIGAYVLLQDVYGQPMLLIRADIPREIYGQGLSSVRYFMSLLLATSLVFGLMTLLLLERVVVSPLARLSGDVSRVSVSGDLTTRMSVSGRDELADLAEAINRMLATLEQAQNSLQRRNRELATLYEATAAISSNLALEPVLLTVAEEVTRALDVTGCTLSLWLREENRIETLVDYSTVWPGAVEPRGTVYPLDDLPARQRVLETGQPVLLQHDDPVAGAAELASMKKWGAFTLLMLPLIARDRVVGLVELIDNVRTHHYAPEDVRLAESLATQAAVAIENARLYERAQQEIAQRQRLEERLAAVHALGQELVLTRNERTISQIAVDAAKILFACRWCALWLVDAGGDEPVCQTIWSGDSSADAASSYLECEREAVLTVVRSGEPHYLPDVQVDPHHVGKEIGVRSTLCVPLKVRDRIIGVLGAGSEELDGFGEDHRQLLLTLADQTALAIENARLYEMAAQQQEHLRALAVRLTETEETERRRLARELHDQVGQNLTALGINLNIVQAQLSAGVTEAVHGRLEDSLALVKQTTQRIRDVMADLQPPVLEDYGLMAALRWYSAQFTSRVGIPVDVRGEEFAPRLPRPVESVLFRVAQEALTNVAKHAQATRATVSVTVDGDLVSIAIADDGVGFDPARAVEPEERHGWGLLTMVDRVEGMGGHFRVDSSSERGTQIIVEVAR